MQGVEKMKIDLEDISCVKSLLQTICLPLEELETRNVGNEGLGIISGFVSSLRL